MYRCAVPIMVDRIGRGWGAMPVELRVLGEIEVRISGRPVRLGHARQRCVLVALALDAARPVPVDQMIDRVWGDPSLRDARNVLYTYIARLRSALAGADDLAIERRQGGYLLSVDPQAVDVHRFRHIMGEVRAAHDDGVARALLPKALDLWRGEPFSGIDNNQWLNTMRTALAQERLVAEMEHADLRLRNGEHTQLLPELAVRAAAHPVNEHAAAQLILALYRTGRQTDALCHYQDVRHRLAAEVGTDPGPALQQLHQQILTADPVVAGRIPTNTAATTASAAVVPRQLPAPPRVFIGRQHELTRLSTVAATGSTLVITAIGGAGGIGKTWLAVHWANQHADRFPDGQLYVNLHGFDPTDQPTPPAVALRGFLDALGADPAALPAELEQQTALFRSVVASKQVLIVLDNARDADQVIPLLPGSPTCTVLITSRHSLTALATTHGAHLLDLDVLSDHEARQLLARHLGAERLTPEPDAVTDLVSTCAGLPLALGIIAARAAQHLDFPLAVLAKELRNAARLDALDAGASHASLRAVLSCSDRVLDDLTAMVFTVLGLAPGSEIGLPAAASLAGLSIEHTRKVLRALENASLVQQHQPGRYHMHDLTHLYASEKAALHLPAAVRADALRRLVDFYLHTAHTADRLLHPYRDPIQLDPHVAGCVLQPLADIGAALRWFDTEHACLLAAQQSAATQGWHPSVWQLAWTLNTFHERRGHAHDSRTCWLAGLVAVEQVGDLTTRTLVRQGLGRACARAGRTAEALDHLRQALTLADEAGDPRLLAYAHTNLASAWEIQGDDRQALSHCQQALKVSQALGDRTREAVGLASVGWLHARLGQYDQAVDVCEQAFVLGGGLNYGNVQAAVLDTFGYIAHQTGRYAAALDYYGAALAGFREIGGTSTEADIHASLGDSHAALGQRAEASAAWRRALDLYRAQHRSTDVERMQRNLTP
jgi:DNA-binding SARP family transcriptional activator/tetratricopeptide (TPR) repeat protein